MHNGYIESVARFGLVGGGLIALGICWLVFGTWRAAVRDSGLVPLVLVSFNALVVLGVLEMITYRFTHWDTTAMIWLVAGAMISAIFNNISSATAEEESPVASH